MTENNFYLAASYTISNIIQLTEDSSQYFVSIPLDNDFCGSCPIYQAGRPDQDQSGRIWYTQLGGYLMNSSAIGRECN